jgi:hypothetical protein
MEGFFPYSFALESNVQARATGVFSIATTSTCSTTKPDSLSTFFQRWQPLGEAQGDEKL